MSSSVVTWPMRPCRCCRGTSCAPSSGRGMSPMTRVRRGIGPPRTLLGHRWREPPLNRSARSWPPLFRWTVRESSVRTVNKHHLSNKRKRSPCPRQRKKSQCVSSTYKTARIRITKKRRKNQVGTSSQRRKHLSRTTLSNQQRLWSRR